MTLIRELGKNAGNILDWFILVEFVIILSVLLVAD